MDDADRTQVRMEAQEAMRRAAEARRAQERRTPRGDCLNCGMPLPDDRRIAGFCDRDCRDDWEWREAAKRRNGR